jgi:hypothetical protein
MEDDMRIPKDGDSRYQRRKKVEEFPSSRTGDICGMQNDGDLPMQRALGKID